MNVTENEPISPADDLIRKYEALTKAAGRILFPKFNYAHADSERTTGLLLFLSHFDRPFFQTILKPGGVSSGIAAYLRIISAILFLVWGILSFTNSTSASIAGRSSYEIKDYIFIILLIILCNITAIGNTIVRIGEKTGEDKVRYGAIQVLAPLIILILINQFVVGNLNNLFISAILFYPGFVLLVRYFPKAFIWWCHFFISMINSLTSFHSPQQAQKVRTLLYCPVKSDSQSFTIVELPIRALNTLKEWAVTNHDTSDKRLNPTIIFLAFLALFTGPERLEIMLYKSVEIVKLTIFGTPTLYNYLEFLGLSFIILVGLLFIKKVIQVFTNISVQSLLIEGCILAEYEVSVREEQAKQVESIKSNTPTPLINLRSWFRKK